MSVPQSNPISFLLFFDHVSSAVFLVFIVYVDVIHMVKWGRFWRELLWSILILSIKFIWGNVEKI